MVDSGEFGVAVLSMRADPIVVCVARQSRCFTKLHDVGLRAFFAAPDCGSVPANGRRRYAVLCASRNSSGYDFVFVDDSGSDRRNLFLEIGSDTLATYCRTAFLLFAALVQHARRHGRVRGGEGKPPW